MTALDDAAAAQDQSKQAALDALARYGTAGNQAYDTANQRITDLQNQALASMANTAAGAPSGQAELASIVRMPGDFAKQSLASGQASLASDLARKQATDSSYFDQAKAAVPAIQASLDAKLAAAAASAGGGGGGGGGSGGGGSSSGGSHYGGYKTEGEYENAVTALARQAATDAQGEPDRLWAQRRADGPTAPTTRTADRNAVQAQLAQAAKQRQGALGVLHALQQHGQNFADKLAGFGGQSPYEKKIAQAQRAYDEANARVQDLTPQQNAMFEQENPEAVQRTNEMQAQANAGVKLRDMGADPLQLYQFAQDVAINGLGADQADALGRFSPEWAMKMATEDATLPNKYSSATSEYDQRQANGGLSDAEVRSQMGFDQFLGKSQERQTPAYEAGATIAQGVLDQFQNTTAPGATLPTKDDLRYKLIMAGIDQQTAALILTDYGDLLPGSSYAVPQAAPAGG